MERWELKVLATFVVLVAIFIPAILPIKVSQIFLKRGVKGLQMLSVIACFGGGVFFGAFLLHILPEVTHLLSTSLMKPNDIHYPVAELIIAAGFFVLFIIDQLMHSLSEASNKPRVHHQVVVSSPKVGQGGEKAGVVNDLPEATAITVRDVSGATPEHSVYVVRLNPESGETSDSAPDSHFNGNNNNSLTDVEKVHLPDNAAVDQQPIRDVTDVEQADKPVPEEYSEAERKQNLSAMKAAVFFIALSFDGIFGGLSLGLQATPEGVWNMTVAILSHELVIAFMLGLQLMRVYRTRVVFTLGTFYAITNPLGIAIGTAIMETMGESGEFDLISGILQALCAGVFIYVTFVEILAQEYVPNRSVTKTLAVLLGFGLMACLAMLRPPIGSEHNAISDNATAISALPATQ